MSEICIWNCGEWCYSHDLPHRIEEFGSPDIEFELPFRLPYGIEKAFIESLLPHLVGRL